MAFSSNLINESQYLQTITDGDFDSIWDHCKDVIEDHRSYSYNSKTDPKDNINYPESIKKQIWINNLLTYSKNTVLNDFPQRKLKLFANYKNSYLLGYTAGYYDSDDNTWNEIFGLVRPDSSGSKAYLYKNPYNVAKYGAIKDLGAVKHIVYAQPGSTTSLRLQHEKSYEHVSSLLDYATITVETIEEEYALNIPETNHIATEDGQRGVTEAKTLDQYIQLVDKITVNIK